MERRNEQGGIGGGDVQNLDVALREGDYQAAFGQDIPSSTRLYFIERVLGALANLLIEIAKMCIAWVLLPFMLTGFLLLPSFVFSALTFYGIKEEKINTLFALLGAFNAFLTGLLVVPVMAIILSFVLLIAAVVTAVLALPIALTPVVLLYNGYQKGIRAVLKDQHQSLEKTLKLLTSSFTIMRSPLEPNEEAVLALLNIQWERRAASPIVPNIEKLTLKALIDHLNITLLTKKIVFLPPGDNFPFERIPTIKKVQEAQKFYALMQATLLDKYNETESPTVCTEIEKLYNLYCQKNMLLRNSLALVRENTPLPPTDDESWNILDRYATFVRDVPNYADLSPETLLSLQTIHRNVLGRLAQLQQDGEDIVVAVDELPLLAQRYNRRARIAHNAEMIWGPDPAAAAANAAAFENNFLLPPSEFKKYKHKRYSEAEIKAYEELALSKSTAEKGKIDLLLKQYRITDERLLSKTCGVGGQYVDIDADNNKFILSKRYKKNGDYLPVPDTNELANTAVDIVNLKMWHEASLRNLRTGNRTTFKHPTSNDVLATPTEYKGEGSVTSYKTEYKVYPYYQYPGQLGREDDIYSQPLADIEKKLNQICPREGLGVKPASAPQPEMAPQASSSQTLVPAAQSQQTLQQEQRETARNARLLKFKFFRKSEDVDNSVAMANGSTASSVLSLSNGAGNE